MKLGQSFTHFVEMLSKAFPFYPHQICPSLNLFLHNPYNHLSQFKHQKKMPVKTEYCQVQLKQTSSAQLVFFL